MTNTIAQVIADAKERILEELHERSERIIGLEGALEDPIDLTDTDQYDRWECRDRQIASKRRDAVKLEGLIADFTQALKNAPKDVRVQYLREAKAEYSPRSGEALHCAIYNKPY